MSASDAIPVPRKNTAYRFYFAIRKPSDSTLITTWTGMDSEVSKDGFQSDGTTPGYTDCTNEATEIATSGTGYIDLTATEMNADCVLLKVTVTNTGAVPLVFTLLPESAGDYRVADTQKVDIETIKTNAVVNAGTITFPTTATLASTVNITAGTITNLTNLPAITANWLTAAGLAADAITEIQTGLATPTNITSASGVTLSGTTQTLDALQTTLNAAHGAGSWATATGFSTHSAADVWAVGARTLTAFGFTVTTANAADVTAILADTNELQTDWTDGGRLDLLIDSIITSIAGQNDLSAADVNAEVLDVLNVDTFAELSSPPAATSTLRDKLTWLFMWARNKATETATQRKLFADDTTTVVSTEGVTDDGTVFTKSEAS